MQVLALYPVKTEALFCIVSCCCTCSSSLKFPLLSLMRVLESVPLFLAPTQGRTYSRWFLLKGFWLQVPECVRILWATSYRNSLGLVWALKGDFCFFDKQLVSWNPRTGIYLELQKHFGYRLCVFPLFLQTDFLCFLVHRAPGLTSFMYNRQPDWDWNFLATVIAFQG